MNIILQPARDTWGQLLQRPVTDPSLLTKQVRKVLDKVKKQGDKALRSFTRQFDGVTLRQLAVTDKEMKAGISQVSEELASAIRQAKENIIRFHQAQLPAPLEIETMPGVKCWRRSVAIEKAGLYVPGGTAPLFSTVLMLGIPASLAGCREIILCTPPQKDGTVHPAVLFAAQEAGITRIFKIGGAQAIAAMAYGTETVPAVYKIFGPGNQYVTCAKQLVQQEGLAIDMPAGPSEVCVLADETANPEFIAADLLSQAEHGADSQVLLVTTSAVLAEAVQKAVKNQVEKLPRRELAVQALSNSKAVVTEDMVTAMELVNAYAAEHLILHCMHDELLAEGVINAGSVFLGAYSPESVGDYASGTNHTLPTNGYARAYSGVSVDSFVKKITYQKLTPDGLKAIAPAVTCMAGAEGLQAHARAVTIRLQ